MGNCEMWTFETHATMKYETYLLYPYRATRFFSYVHHRHWHWRAFFALSVLIMWTLNSLSIEGVNLSSSLPLELSQPSSTIKFCFHMSFGSFCLLPISRKATWGLLSTLSIHSTNLFMAIILIGNDPISRNGRVYGVCFLTWRNFVRKCFWTHKSCKM